MPPSVVGELTQDEVKRLGSRWEAGVRARRVGSVGRLPDEYRPAADGLPGLDIA